MFHDAGNRKEREPAGEEFRHRDLVGRVVGGGRHAAGAHHLAGKPEHRETALVNRSELEVEQTAEVERAVDFLFQGVMALPYHIYVVSSKIPQNEFTERVQYGTAFVFLVIVALIAASSILLRNRLRARYKW